MICYETCFTTSLTTYLSKSSGQQAGGPNGVVTLKFRALEVPLRADQIGVRPVGFLDQTLRRAPKASSISFNVNGYRCRCQRRLEAMSGMTSVIHTVTLAPPPYSLFDGSKPLSQNLHGLVARLYCRPYLGCRRRLAMKINRNCPA
jgi:hypothetical protein